MNERNNDQFGALLKSTIPTLLYMAIMLSALSLVVGRRITLEVNKAKSEVADTTTVSLGIVETSESEKDESDEPDVLSDKEYNAGVIEEEKTRDIKDESETKGPYEVIKNKTDKKRLEKN